MKAAVKLGALLVVSIFSFFSHPLWAATQQVDPNLAYDPVNRRYLMVWEDEIQAGKSEIKGQFVGLDGKLIGNAAVTLSPKREKQGCLYEGFPSVGTLTKPTNCPINKNPSVAYNDGKFIVVWEVHGVADFPRIASNASDAEKDANKFAVIFARIVEADDLQPLRGWDEGILISQVQTSSRKLVSECPGHYTCQDSDIRAWGQNINPSVAPWLGQEGFVVTWQSTADFIGCFSPDRRQGYTIYARYIDNKFSATAANNPQMFSVFKDTSVANVGNENAVPACESLNNVNNGTDPRIAYNQISDEFIVSYEVAIARGGRASIGAKKITMNADKSGKVNGNLMPDIVASVEGKDLHNADLVPFKDHYVLLTGDGTDIRAKSFKSDAIAISEPIVLALGDGAKLNPRMASNLGVGGFRSAAPENSAERIAVGYEKQGAIYAALLDEDFQVKKIATKISDSAVTPNSLGAVASDLQNFTVAWSGNSNGNKIFSGLVEIDGTVMQNPPSAPTNLQALAVSYQQVNLTWNSDADNVDNFKVERAIAAEGGECVADDFAEVTTVDAGETRYSDMGLTAATTYCYRVFAANEVGLSGASNIVKVTTDQPPQQAPLAPTGLRIQVVSLNEINLSWTDASEEEEGFRIERASIVAGSDCTPGSFANPTLANVGADETEYMDRNLRAATTYCYRVKAFNQAGESDYSNIVKGTTDANPIVVPSAPADLSARVVSQERIDLSWSDTSANENGFSLERMGINAGDACDVANPIDLGQLAADTDTYSDRGLTTATTYCYRVRAFNADGFSDYSNVVRATTEGEPNQAPAAPALLTPANHDAGTAWAPTRVYLSWDVAADPDAGDTVSYDVYFVQAADMPEDARPYKSNVADTHFIIQASTDNRAEYNPDQGVQPLYLTPDQNYTWKICARDNRGGTTCSEPRHFNTDNSVVGWWRFAEDPNGGDCPNILGGPAGDPGETVCDYSGRGNHGVPHGGVAWLAPGVVPDILGGALEFDGVDDYVEVANFSNDGQMNLSITVRMHINANPPEEGGIFTIVGKVLVAAIGVRNDEESSRAIMNIGNGAGWYLPASALVAPSVLMIGSSYQMSFTYNGVSGAIFINGVLDTSGPIGGGGTLGTNDVSPVIGSHLSTGGGQNQFLDGAMDELVIYNTLISSDVITNDFLTAQ